MGQGGIRAGARDARERDVLQRAGLDAEGLERLDRIDLGELARRRLAVEPGEEAGDRHAVAQMGRVRAGDLGLVLDRLHEGDRIGADIDLAAGRLDAPDQGDGAGGRIDADLAAGPAELVERALEGADRREVGEIADGVAGLVRHLRRIEEQARAALPGQDRIAERQGRVPHIAAAQVEGPGEVVRIGDDERVELRLRHLLADALELGGRGLAGIVERMRPHGSLRRGRAVDPDHIDEIDVDGRKLSAGTLHRLLQPLQAVAGVKPRIVGEHAAGRQVFGDPVLGRGIGELDRRDDGGVDLLGRLHRVAPVDHEGGLVLAGRRRCRPSR